MARLESCCAARIWDVYNVLEKGRDDPLEKTIIHQ